MQVLIVKAVSLALALGSTAEPVRAQPLPPLSPAIGTLPDGTAALDWFYRGVCDTIVAIHSGGPHSGRVVHDPGAGGSLAIRLEFSEPMLLDSLGVFLAAFDGTPGNPDWELAGLAGVIAEDSAGMPAAPTGDTLFLDNVEASWPPSGSWIRAAWNVPVPVDGPCWLQIIWPPTLEPIVEIGWDHGAQSADLLAGFTDGPNTQYIPIINGNPLVELGLLTSCDRDRNTAGEDNSTSTISFTVVRMEHHGDGTVHESSVPLALTHPLTWVDSATSIGRTYRYAVEAVDDDLRTRTDTLTYEPPQRWTVDMPAAYPTVVVSSGQTWVARWRMTNQSTEPLVVQADTAIYLSCADPISGGPNCSVRVTAIAHQPPTIVFPGASLDWEGHFTTPESLGTYYGDHLIVISDTLATIRDRYRVALELLVQEPTAVRSDEGIGDEYAPQPDLVLTQVGNWDSHNDVIVTVADLPSPSGIAGIGTTLSLVVYNILGQRVWTLPAATVSGTGCLRLVIDGSRHWARGVYMFELRAAGERSVTKLAKSR